MFALYSHIFVDCILLISSIEFIACIGICIWDERNRIHQRVRASLSREITDPFAPWVSMLERQRDRRDGLRYGGVERRSKASYAAIASN